MSQDLYLDVDIHKRLKEFDLDMEFRAEKGVLGILGASGCGKSMTLKSIAGIVTPDSGFINVHAGEDNYLYHSAEKVNQKPQERRVGYLFQNYALFPNMTVETNIGIGMGKKKDPEKIRDLVERFHLQGLEDRFPRQLSGGQQQRVALARILAYEPKVMLLDEPFSAMDSFLKESLRLQLRNVLKTFDGICIMVTHDRDEAFQLCDHLLLLDRGKVIAKGKTRDVFENPGSVQAARLTGCKNISRIEKIDEHTCRATDFGNLLLTVDREIGDDTHIGIRAHDIHSDFTGVHRENVIPCENAEISEMPFEWHVRLESGLFWKKEKDMHTYDSTDLLPKQFFVDSDKILLLKDLSE